MLRSQLHTAVRRPTSGNAWLHPATSLTTSRNAQSLSGGARQVTVNNSTTEGASGSSTHQPPRSNISNTPAGSGELSKWSTVIWPLPSSHHDATDSNAKRFVPNPYRLRTSQDVAETWHHLAPTSLPEGFSCNWSHFNLIHGFTSGAYYYDMGPLALLFKICYELPDPIRGVMYRKEGYPTKGCCFVFQAGDGVYYDWNNETDELRRFKDIPPWTPVGELTKRIKSKVGGLQLSIVNVSSYGTAEYERRREEQFNKRARAEAYRHSSRTS